MQNRKNIQVDGNFTADKETFFMCNLYCATPKTSLPNVKNCTFERCNLYGCEVEETNTLKQSNVVDTTPKLPEQTPEERIAQLEKFISDNSLIIPKKVQ